MCEPGYQGALCEIKVDNCLSVPCLHGATCHNKVNNYSCDCTSFYKGRHCEIGIFLTLTYFFNNFIILIIIFNLEIPNALEDGRKSAMAISISVVGFILLILCLMDLPWSSIKKIFCCSLEINTKVKEDNAHLNNNKKHNFKEDSKMNKDRIVATDEEILKKFKMIMTQNNVRKSANAISPSF